MIETDINATKLLAVPSRSALPGDGFIFRFDPTLTQFQVITLPTVVGQSRRPHSLAIIPNSTAADIWYTDPGTNRIGRLIYTSTNDYTLTEFNDLPADSEPFDIVANNGYLWFTARRGNWIGRFEISTTTMTPYSITTANSLPWSIDVGSDGSVWFTEKQANKLGRLIVTDTVDKKHPTADKKHPVALFEYVIPRPDSQPQGLSVKRLTGGGLDEVWFSETAPPDQNRLARFDLESNSFLATIPVNGLSQVVNVTTVGNFIWFTELLGNNISSIETGTGVFFPDQYPIPTANSQPYDLIIDVNNDLWFSERVGRNLGKLSGLGNDVEITEFPIPIHLSPVWLQGIALDAQNNIWLTGFVAEQIYLPTILKGS